MCDLFSISSLPGTQEYEVVDEIGHGTYGGKYAWFGFMSNPCKGEEETRRTHNFSSTRRNEEPNYWIDRMRSKGN